MFFYSNLTDDVRQQFTLNCKARNLYYRMMEKKIVKNKINHSQKKNGLKTEK